MGVPCSPLYSPLLAGGPLNAGENILFWRVTLLGRAVTVSGRVLHFPHCGQSRDTLQLYYLIHVAAALPLIALSCPMMLSTPA